MLLLLFTGAVRVAYEIKEGSVKPLSDGKYRDTD
jgi:hypothetical protein